MKKLLLSILTMASLGASAQIVNIPDANFKTYLVNDYLINTNGDLEIQVTEAAAYTGVINCSNLSISDLTGIEAFTDLTELTCANNSLTSLDVTQNTDLTDLGCGNNLLTTLDVTQNTVLTMLACYDNSLTSLNVANGNNSNFFFFTALNNPNLTCIQVDNVAYSTTNWTEIDATASFSTNCATVGINETTQSLDLTIYPNPTTGKVTFSATEQISSIEIYNLTGQKIVTFNNANTIDISNLTSGVYFAKVITVGSSTVMQKLIKE